MRAIYGSILCAAAIYFDLVDAAPRAAPRRRQEPHYKKKYETVEEAAYALIFIMSILIVPMLVYFVYNILKDPVTPLLIRDLTDYAKEKSFGFLSDMGVKIDDGSGGKQKTQDDELKKIA